MIALGNPKYNLYFDALIVTNCFEHEPGSLPAQS